MANIQASDIYNGVNDRGCDYFVGCVAQMVESALADGKKNISIDKLVDAFECAKEYTREKGGNSNGSS